MFEFLQFFMPFFDDKKCLRALTLVGQVSFQCYLWDSDFSGSVANLRNQALLVESLKYSIMLAGNVGYFFFTTHLSSAVN